MKALKILLIAVMISTSAHALERSSTIQSSSSGNGADSALSSYKKAITDAIKDYDALIKSLETTINNQIVDIQGNEADLSKLLNCQNKAMLYAPGHGGADSDGCLQLADLERNCVALPVSINTAYATCTPPDYQLLRYTSGDQENFDARVTICCAEGGMPLASTPSTPTPPSYSDCTFNGTTVAHGSSVIAYSAASAVDCSTVSQTRTCSDGTLSGSYPYASCTPSGPTTTSGPWTTGSWTDAGSCDGACGGGSGNKPQTRTVTCDYDTCTGTKPADTRTTACTNSTACTPTTTSGPWTTGSWSDTSSCSASCGGGTKTQSRSVSCSYDTCTGSKPSDTRSVSCNTTACPTSGAWTTGSWSDSGSCSVSCGGGTKPQTRSVTCSYDTCTGSKPADTRSVSCNTTACAPTYADCSFNGKTVKHGNSVTAYQYTNPPKCSANQQTRTCNDGSLSGSYPYDTCTDKEPDSCVGKIGCKK